MVYRDYQVRPLPTPCAYVCATLSRAVIKPMLFAKVAGRICQLSVIRLVDLIFCRLIASTIPSLFIHTPPIARHNRPNQFSPLSRGYRVGGGTNIALEALAATSFIIGGGGGDGRTPGRSFPTHRATFEQDTQQ